ncbi:MAG: DUF350 domain-containing protein, partial [Acidobacteriota bacterium]
GRRAPRQSLTRQTAFDELKPHLRGAQIVLRSKTPELVEQDFYGLLMAHFAVRGLMQEAALQAEAEPDRLSFLHSVRVVQRRMARSAAIPPRQRKTVHVAVLGEILQERCVFSRNWLNARGVKRKMSNYPLRPRKRQPTQRIEPSMRIRNPEMNSIGASILISLACGIVGFFAIYKLFDWITPELDFPRELGKGNLAVAVFLAGLFIGVGLLLGSAIK